MCTHVPVQENTSIILLWEISTDSFCTCHGSEAHLSFKFPFGMQFQDSQERVVRIRIKQSIWNCRAGIDMGLARKKPTFFCRSVVGEVVSWEWICVFLQEWYKPGSTSYKCFPHLFQPLLSLTSLGGVTGRSKEASRYPDSCHGSKRQTPTGVSTTGSLVQTTAQEAMSYQCS